MHSEDTRTGIFLPHVSILGNHHCGKERCGEFKLWGNLHDFLCRLDYAKRVVSSFSHQIQSEYYGRNIYVSIEGISLEHFSASHHPIPLLASYHVSCQEVFNYLFSYDRKQDVSTTAEHSKRIIGLLQNITVLFADMINI